MFHFSTDSLMEYEQDYNETPIMLERINEEDSDYIIPTIPNKSQWQSIQDNNFLNLYPEPEPEQEQEQEPAFYPPKYTKHEDLPTPTKQIIDPPKLPFLMNIYVGSLTVVGLFLIFRFIQK